MGQDVLIVCLFYLFMSESYVTHAELEIPMRGLPWDSYCCIIIYLGWGEGTEVEHATMLMWRSKNNLRESSSLFSLLWVLGIKSKSSDLEQKPSLRQGHSNQGLRRQGLSSQGLSRQGFSRGAFARWTFFFLLEITLKFWSSCLCFLGLQAYTTRVILHDAGIKARVSQILGQSSPDWTISQAPRHTLSVCKDTWSLSRLAWNSFVAQASLRTVRILFYLPRAGITGMKHHIQLFCLSYYDTL